MLTNKQTYQTLTNKELITNISFFFIPIFILTLKIKEKIHFIFLFVLSVEFNHSLIFRGGI